MPRYMSFALTTEQYKQQTKTVTRRVGWGFLTRGYVLYGCEKAQGLKKGEKIVYLGTHKVVDTRWEPLQRMIDDPEYGRAEVIKEGFPHMTPAEFVEMFCRTHRCLPQTAVNRIEFEYL